MSLDPEEFEQVAELIKKEEGFKSIAYDDISKDGVPRKSVGYGFNQGYPGIDTLLANEGLNPTQVWAGTQPVNETQANNILNQIITNQQTVLNDIHNKANPYSQWPTEAKAVANNMIYVLGEEDYLDFEEYRAGIDYGDYAKAAKEIVDSKWTEQLKGLLVNKNKIVRTERLAAQLNNLQGRIAIDDAQNTPLADLRPNVDQDILGFSTMPQGAFGGIAKASAEDYRYAEFLTKQLKTRNIGGNRNTVGASFAGADIRALLVMPDDYDRLIIIADYLTKFNEYLDRKTVNGNIQGSNQLAIDTASAQAFSDLAAVNGQSIYNFMQLVNLQTITVSTFRSKRQVRALGQVNPKGFARGSRTSAGTMILTEFDRDAFWDFIQNAQPLSDTNIGDGGSPLLIDQIAPFDVILLFQNEYGVSSYRYIYGVEIATNGSVYSIQDMYIENTVSFLCMDVTPLTPIGDIRENIITLGDKVLKVGHRIGNLTQVQNASQLAYRFRQSINSQNPYR